MDATPKCALLLSRASTRQNHKFYMGKHCSLLLYGYISLILILCASIRLKQDLTSESPSDKHDRDLDAVAFI
ncbi:hypothetical protein BC938DRAFT_481542 [Jimgerdemannia flammicorona]|uniref:Uncharacterized protein n=1 Tax=Jimgerdemannia flammicorona TaxID=994334 RepID=A0A433QFW7_9FUNG|nr:hypothetical protein BC938DRAFT_481542 [Jimgerdemannia flammicorona]